MKNWHDGALLALLFNLTLAHQTFPNPQTSAHGGQAFFKRWNEFLDWNRNEHSLLEITRNYNLTVIDLPTQEDNAEGETWHLHPNMLTAYSGLRQLMILHQDKCHVLFRQKQDQWSWHVNRLKWASVGKYAQVSRPTSNIGEAYAADVVNIAVHIRRGDVTKTNHTNKFQSNGWFKSVVSLICKSLPGLKKQVHIFSQAGKEEFDDIILSDALADTCGAPRGAAVRYMDDMSDIQTFDHFVNADILVLSESGLSKMAALLSPKALAFGPSTIVWEHPPPGMVMLDRRSGKVLNRATAIAKIRAWKNSWTRQHIGPNIDGSEEARGEVASVDVVLMRHLFRLLMLHRCFDIRAGHSATPPTGGIANYKALLARSGPVIQSYLGSKQLQVQQELLHRIFPEQPQIVAAAVLGLLGGDGNAQQVQGCPLEGGVVDFGVHSEQPALRTTTEHGEL
jgi:hypothetical protein